MIKATRHGALAIFATFALATSACTITTGGDGVGGGAGESSGGDSGSGGSDSGGSSSGGTGTGGSTAGTSGSAGEASGGSSGSGTGGSGGDDGLACEFSSNDTPATCEVDEDADCCTKCLQTRCCDEFGACLGTPFNVCGGDEDNENSEINCVIECMVDFGPIRDDAEDLTLCATDANTQCYAPSATFCGGLQVISAETNALATCMHGATDEADIEDDPGCFEECFFEHDTDYVCPY
jgi:hypothetical protein